MHERQRTNHIAVFWDFENVPTFLGEGVPESLMDFLNHRGRVIAAYAFADWQKYDSGAATEVSRAGFDLIHVPDAETNATDYKLASYIFSHLVRYDSDTDTIVIVSGDRDFEIVVGALRDRGKNILIVGKAIITAERLIELAEFVDIETFRRSALVEGKTSELQEHDTSLDELRRQAALSLQETIQRIENAGKKAGVGYIKTVFLAENPSYSEDRLGFDSWTSFLDWAEKEGYIESSGSLPGTILRISSHRATESDEQLQKRTEAFEELVGVVESLIESGRLTTLPNVGTEFKKRGLALHGLGFRRLMDFALAAEARGYVRSVPGDDMSQPRLLPVYSTERMRAWFERHADLFGTSVNIPKPLFLNKMSRLLFDYGLTLGQLESLLRSDEINREYDEVLASNGTPYLPPFQKSLVFVLRHSGLDWSEVVERANPEIEPLGFTLAYHDW